MDTKRNGTLPNGRVYANGTVVSVMPRKMALLSAQQAGISFHNNNFNPATEEKLNRLGNHAIIRSHSRGANGVLVYTLKNPSGYTIGNVPEWAIFGQYLNIGDVVEVSSTGTTSRPPERRVFLGYAFDHKCTPMVMAYSERDSIALLENGNTAVVNLEDAEAWAFSHPAESCLIPAAPEYEVSIRKNGVPVRVRDLNFDEWEDIYEATH